jgi:hypothetical protein
MHNTVNNDLAKKAEARLEFRRFGTVVYQFPPEVRARHVEATNDRYATGPGQDERIPVFTLPDQNGAV